MNAKVEANLEMLKQNVRQKFAEILAAVQMREKLLLRQLDVIATTQLQQTAGSSRCHVTSSSQPHTPASPAAEVKFLAEQETELMASIRSFGRFQLDNMNMALQDVYLKNEDYIEPTDDHETMYKCLPEAKLCSVELPVAEPHNASAADGEQPEAIVVDFSRNKSLVEHSRKLMNKSIINITLQEAKELIRKARLKRETSIPPLNLEEFDDEMESSIADALSSLEYRNDISNNGGSAKHSLASQSVPLTKKQSTVAERAEATTTTSTTSTTAASIPKKCKTKRSKPKITINNCNGTINLRNIASLTINCASEEAISAEIPLQIQTDDEDDDRVEHSGTAKSKRVNKKSSLSATAAVKKALESLVDSSSTNNTETTATTTPTTTASSSNYSSNASSRSQSKKQKKTQNEQKQQLPESLSNANANNCADIVFADGDEDINANASCDFYNRLLNEIKHNLHEKPTRCYKSPAMHAAEPDSTSFNADSSLYSCSSAAAKHSCQVSSSNGTQNTLATGSSTQHTATQAQAQPPNKRLILKNFENLKIILEANSGDEDTFHPVQIEQWLAEIISETDLEPMPNNDILEHSKLHDASNSTPLDEVTSASAGDNASDAVAT